MVIIRLSLINSGNIITIGLLSDVSVFVLQYYVVWVKTTPSAYTSVQDSCIPVSLNIRCWFRLKFLTYMYLQRLRKF